MTPKPDGLPQGYSSNARLAWGSECSDLVSCDSGEVLLVPLAGYGLDPNMPGPLTTAMLPALAPVPSPTHPAASWTS